MSGPIPKAERLAAFLQRMGAALPAKSHDEALRLLADTMNSIEDEMSGVPYDPARSFMDGRLYPPTAEFEIESDVAGARCYRQRGHLTYVARNGSIRICRKDGGTVLSKPGADGVQI